MNSDPSLENVFITFELAFYRILRNSFSFQVVGNEHNTLIFDIKSPTSHQQSTKLQHTSLFVCIAGDASQKERLEFHVQETFR